MMRVRSLLASLLITASPAVAQIQPVGGAGDPHLQTVDYDSGQIVQLRSAPGYQLMVELSPDEAVQTVALGDSSAWQVNVNKAGDRLFLKPAQASSTTNMTVVTSVRVYNFDLFGMSGPSADMPYTVQFHYPQPKAAVDGEYVDVSAIARRLSRYRVSGDRLLRPNSMSDDGQRTYISWPKGSPIPAIYTTDRVGNEILVNGMMGADDTYVVDGAPQRFVFRIDRQIARAQRLNPRKSR